MKSRIYSSRFYPPEYFSLIITAPNSIFYDLEKSNAERAINQIIRAGIRQRAGDGCLSIVNQASPDEVSHQQNKVVSVKIVGDGSKFESISRRESERIEKVSMGKSSRTTIFSLFYENGEKRTVEVLNGSYLFRVLINQCKKV